MDYSIRQEKKRKIAGFHRRAMGTHGKTGL